ncbi:hypothetical protein AVEN_86067-1 [Araneus ventricosus]|uniref:Uncharacterized protein n=1 Tax=Araneus ventricosus TaxID=182803 RepID=A0A4Y2IMG6_ARAVE|nr:hypothetical protein AVEN_253340-1 [Araneus ventricosus]GBM79048.1 hypothetical protein AVEN_86067-1 [Araneus ventricosus]
MTRTTPDLPLLSPNFRATPKGGRLVTTYELICNRPHTLRNFSGIGFQTWTLRLQSQDLPTRPTVPKRDRDVTRVFSRTFILSSRLEVNDRHPIFVKLSFQSQY